MLQNLPADQTPISYTGDSSDLNSLKDFLRSSLQNNSQLTNNFSETNEFSDLIDSLLGTYEIEIISTESRNRDKMQRVNEILEDEGCAFCLYGADNSNEEDCFVLLSCRVLTCFHVCHLSCLAHNYNLQRNTGLSPIRISQYHSVNFLHEQSFIKVDSSDENTPRHIRSYEISLELSHIISNATSMRIDWPDPINSLLDPLTGSEYLMLSLDDGQLDLEAKPMPMFCTKRGKLFFSCVDQTSGRSWEHETNYDIFIQEEMFLLVHKDMQSRNTLTVGLKRELVASSNVTAYSVLFVKYDFDWEQPQTPMLSLTPEAFVPICTPGSPDYVQLSNQFHEASPFFVHNDSSPTTPNSAYYKVNAGSPVIDCLEKNKNCFKKKIEHNGTLYDFTPIASPINSFSLPISHSPSILYDSMSPILEMKNLNLMMNEFPQQTMYQNAEKSFEPTSFSEPPAQNSSPEEQLDVQQDLTSNKNKETVSNNSIKSDDDHNDKNNEKQKQIEVTNLLYNISIGAPLERPKKETMRELSKHIFTLSKSQSGSRFIQDNLSDYFDVFFRELKPHVVELMTDSFGHYAFDELFAASDSQQRSQLLLEVSRSFQYVACHKQGSFSMQSAIEAVENAEHVQMFSQFLERSLHAVSISCSGHYVVLRFIQKFKFPTCKFMVEKLSKKPTLYAVDHYGLRVIKTLLEIGSRVDVLSLCNAIAQNTDLLVSDQFGNYIIQHLLDFGPEEVKTEIKRKMNGKFVRFSKQKFSSNVVEKCLKVSDQRWKAIIVRQLINSPSELINDKFGNYCLQTALVMCDKELTVDFTNSVYPTLSRLVIFCFSAIFGDF